MINTLNKSVSDQMIKINNYLESNNIELLLNGIQELSENCK